MSGQAGTHPRRPTPTSALDQWAQNIDKEDLKRATADWCQGLEEANDTRGYEIGSDVDWHRELYWRLMNVEQFPEALPVAFRFLQQQFQIAAEEARIDIENAHEESLAYSLRDGYTPEGLESFMLAQHTRTMDAYHAYREEWDRKRAQYELISSLPNDDEGGLLRHANAMFPTKEYAKWWLLQNAPTKLVDGSWLQHAGGIGTADEDDKRTAMPLYKTFVEELGDGVLKMNHVSVYETCLESQGISHPPHHTRAFSQDPRLPSHAYTRGCVQLALGQFAAHDLFPEALGYNLGYEQLPLHLLITTHELPLMDIDANYFMLHISIDNGATGHAKMAVDAVVQYLDRVRVERGVDAMREHWQRILTGFYLSERSPLKAHLDARRALHRSASPPRAVFSTAAACIFASKAPYAHKIHPPDAMVGSQPLHYWLDPEHATERSAELVQEMEKSRWVVRGAPGESALIGKLCGFGGPMFAVFTEAEMEVLGEWIRGLTPAPEKGDGAATSCPFSGRDAIVNGKCPMSGHAERGEIWQEQAPDAAHNTSKCPISEQPGRVSVDGGEIRKEQARKDVLPLISTKSRAGKFRHGSLTLTDPNSGAPRTINSLLAANDPAAVLDALVASGSARAFLDAVHDGGCMAQWFDAKDRAIVEAWVTSLDVAENAEVRSIDSGHAVAPSAEGDSASRRSSLAGAKGEPSDSVLTAALDIIAGAAAASLSSSRNKAAATECNSTTTPFVHLHPHPPMPIPSASALIPLLSSPTSAAHHLGSYILAHPFPPLSTQATATDTTGATLDSLHPLLQHISLGVPVTNHASPARHPTRIGATHLLFRRALVESNALGAVLRTLSPTVRRSEPVDRLLVYLLATAIRVDAGSLAAVCKAVVVLLDEITPLVGTGAVAQWRKMVGGLKSVTGDVEPDAEAMRLWSDVRLVAAY
ncbi:hypothetical protein HDU86_003380 [Geranomyces michiganensis]|nr:hypothetical protein HDU86_003380 [Geranomyces michiganensis]